MSESLEIRIIQVENGYVVLNDHPGLERYSCPKWVARTPEELSFLVMDLARQTLPKEPKSVTEG